MEDKMIMIGVGARPQGEPMSEDLGMAEEADAEMFEAMAPRGNFTSRGLDPLVRSDTEVLPTDFVRILAMFQAAVEDAISEDVLREEMRIDLDGVIDDTGLMTIAGKLDMLSKDREFKKFLKEPMDDEVAGEEEMGMEMEDEAMTEDEMDRMMMARM
jgi:hypothetical protein